MVKPAHTCHARLGPLAGVERLVHEVAERLRDEPPAGRAHEHPRWAGAAAMHPNGTWMLAADATIALVHLATGRPIHGHLLPGAMSYAVGMDGDAEAVAFAKRVIAASTGPVVEKLREAWGLPAPGSPE